jgi:hypothetical protein
MFFFGVIVGVAGLLAYQNRAAVVAWFKSIKE